MASKNESAIKIKSLNVIYNDQKLGLNAIQDVNFNVLNNEFVSIVGPSGCGKSTLLKILSDTLNNKFTDYSGSVEILGCTPQKARTDRKVGIVFQKPTLLEWRNVVKNITLPLEINGFDKNLIPEKVNKLVKLVDLQKYTKFRPSQLSGGMQQKVSIARALAYDPEILLMDEPFGALDEINRRKLNDELINIWQKTSKTVVFITHSIEEAVYLSQRIIVLTKQPGTIKEIVDINLPYPRSEVMDKPQFFNYVVKVRKLLEDEELS